METTLYSSKKTARFAGFLYLLLVIFGIFSEMIVRDKLKVPHDAAATARHILEHEFLFRLSIVSDMLCQISHLFLVLVLYVWLKHVHRNAALILLATVVVSVAIVFLNLLHQHAALLILKNPVYDQAFTEVQQQALSYFFFQLHGYGYGGIGGFFFGLWLYPMGYLVYKSGYFPRIIGIGLMIGCFGYLLDVCLTFLFPDHTSLATPGLLVATLAELAFCFWLLIKGATYPKPTPLVSYE